MADIRTVHLARHRFLPAAGGGTVFCVMTYDGRVLGALAYLTPGQFPEFEGEEAWFRVRWFSKRRREFLEQIERPSWVATEKR
ncbi:MAG: hypothetical protein KJ676_01160 [Alphaproteobacteria bacterium]|nr:hypothetical protein [Alphaproteobacteria bacterium]MBU1527400.1 hypothetical protein [Alphaproteobacteria bacterium]MBU2350807.1 hypothetical protein [Alphaproteobacteria bacterium]MBU2381144.1 hypothetical protein [Alphaproteobacteria bacterium]